jgi:ABC-type bacteriocin/lantibiotic exporter with double-glycine peptidase domain
MMPLAFLAIFLTASNVWIDIPFVQQTENGCGSAVAWMVLEYWSPGSTLDEIHRALYSTEKNGVSTRDMQRFFGDRDFKTWSFAGEWTDLEHHLSLGRPIIVGLKSGRHTRLIHFVTVTGFDNNRNVVLLNDPAGRKLQKMDRSDFEQQWRLTDNWSLLVVPQ